MVFHVSPYLCCCLVLLIVWLAVVLTRVSHQIGQMQHNHVGSCVPERYRSKQLLENLVVACIVWVQAKRELQSVRVSKLKIEEAQNDCCTRHSQGRVYRQLV